MARILYTHGPICAPSPAAATRKQALQCLGAARSIWQAALPPRAGFLDAGLQAPPLTLTGPTTQRHGNILAVKVARTAPAAQQYAVKIRSGKHAQHMVRRALLQSEYTHLQEGQFLPRHAHVSRQGSCTLGVGDILSASCPRSRWSGHALAAAHRTRRRLTPPEEPAKLIQGQPRRSLHGTKSFTRRSRHDTVHCSRAS